MNILLHICCAPCAIFPLKSLRALDHEVTGYFYRQNIHPYLECVRRQETLQSYSETVGLRVIYQKGYDLESFLQKLAFRESKRCFFCYHERLRATARVAKHGKFDSFSTTLLYSKFQKHNEIREIGEAVGASVGVRFFYQDFRPGWQEGVETSKQLGLYRQQYCGCIYSEKERYFKS